MELRTKRSYFVLPVTLLILCVGGFTYLFGPLDRVPRLHSSAQSPDGVMTVKIYRQKVSNFSPSEVRVFAKVFDRQGNLVYERKIGQVDVWVESGNQFRNITFVGDEIHVGPKFGPDEYSVISKSDLGAAR